MANQTHRAETAREKVRELLDIVPESGGHDLVSREKLLGVYSLLGGNEDFDISKANTYGYLKRGQLEGEERIDRLEYLAGYPPRRHAWLEGVERKDVFPAFLRRMGELQLMPERDSALENATAEMASFLLMRPDADGNMFVMYHQVRSNEVYHQRRNDVPRADATVVGFPLQWGRFGLGQEAGFQEGDPNYERWFLTDLSAYVTPLDMITSLGNMWEGGGAQVGVEYSRKPVPIAAA